jgi:DNA-binding CsgD family transcriptional regulator/tetratricopeptide (TPR) repeat protein
VAHEVLERIRRNALSFAFGLRISGGWGPTSASQSILGCAILAGMQARASEVFVGRIRELGELERALAATVAGRGSTALVAGEAGIGKTRLASELGRRARDAGFEVLLGRSIDLVGTELPYQPFLEALRPLGELRRVDGKEAGSQLQAFEETLTLLTDRAASAPVLLILEDLHWADISTLDLVVFLAHNLDDRPLLLLATYRADEPASAERVRRLADGVRRSGSALVLELGPLGRDELTALLAAHADVSLPAAVADTIVARSGGNPFFAEELLAVMGDAGGQLPQAVGVLLMQRVASLDRATQRVLRLAAAAGREVGYPLLQATVELSEGDLRDSLQQAVEQSVLVADQARGTFRFRHGLLAEAIYATILPGEREDLHARLADALTRNGAPAAELAPHWAAAGRNPEALVASVEAARQAEAVFGLPEARAHLERALVLWDVVPEAAELVKLELAELCSWTAELTSGTGSAPRAVELQRRAIDLVRGGDRRRAALLYARLSRYLYECGEDDAGLAALGQAVELVPAQPPSAERAEVLARLGSGLRLAWRFEESLAICQEALAVARAVGAHEAEFRALDVLGSDLVYLGRTEEGLAQLRRVLELAEKSGDPLELRVAYVSLTDAYTMLGRPQEAARLGAAGLEAMRGSGVENTVLEANYIEALLAIGEWETADEASATALRAVTANYPYMLLGQRAYLEIGRGRFDEARAHLLAAQETLRPDRGLGIYDVVLAELALWERRWTNADRAVQDALARASSRQAAQLRVWFCATGLRAKAELAALARARRDSDAHAGWLDRARKLIAIARDAAAEAAAITPNAAAWLAMAEAEYERARGSAPPERWSETARIWARLERPPLAAYCRWREAEALVAAGVSRTEASAPLREAHAVATRIGAEPLLREIELLAQRARLDLAPPITDSHRERESVEEILGLTPREAEVLALVARGYTNREIAATLVISVKTAGVHVSHILRKLGAPNRLEAAAIAHRLTPPHGG